MLAEYLDELRRPFHPSHVTWKPGAVKGERALALAYADVRAYMNRLDEVCGADWAITYEPWGENRIICRLTIGGVNRSSTGESTNESERSEIGGTVAEAQAFKRACTMFGLGRYLYNLPTGWADFDPTKKQFTEAAKAKLMGLLVNHYRRATEGKVEVGEIFQEAQAGEPEQNTALDQFTALGKELYGDQWEQVSRRNISRISAGAVQAADKLSGDQLQRLIDGMMKVKSKREPALNGDA